MAEGAEEGGLDKGGKCLIGGVNEGVRMGEDKILRGGEKLKERQKGGGRGRKGEKGKGGRGM